MRTVRVKSLGEFRTKMKAEVRGIQKGLDRARARVARRLVPIVRQNVPVAFSELRDDVHADGSKVIADSPHAAAVERGARPHFPPLEPLIAWVRLRMTQGLLSDSQIARLTGSTSAGHALAMNDAASAFVISRNRRGQATALSIDAPRRIAFAIAKRISERGTKPHWYMQNAVPIAQQMLEAEVQSVLSRSSAEG